MPKPSRRALLVGVNSYPKMKACSQLSSCVNDARLVADVLSRRHGFRADDMSLLLDEAATNEKILAGLAALRDRAQDGDAVVFYFSGHGSRMADQTKPDGWVETLVPHDSGRDPDPNRDIADDEIYEWLLGISEVTRNVVVIVDSCFAAGSTRGEPEAREKWIDPDPRPRRRTAARSARLLAGTGGGFRDAGPSGFLPLDDRYVLLAACRADERAKELRTKPPVSAFTCFLCQALLSAPEEATYREVVEQVRLAVAREVREQTPQVEGARDRVVFDEITSRPEPFLPLLARQGELVELGGGAVHGVEMDSQWAVYPQGTRGLGAGEPLGIVRIESAQVIQSRGVIVQGGERIVAGARAFKRASGPRWLRLAVALPQGSQEPVDTELAAAVARSPLLVPLSGGEEGAVRLVAAEPRTAAAEEGPARDGPLAVGVEESSWIVLSSEGELLLPPVAKDRRHATAMLIRGLEDLARARNLLALAPDAGAEACAAADLKVELLRKRGDDPFSPAVDNAGGEVVYQANDRLGLRISHQAEWPLHVHVFDIGLMGVVSQLYPMAGASGLLAAGRNLEIGTAPREALTVYIPDDFATMAHMAGRKRLEGREALKIFLTGGATDLSGWTQPAIRGASRAAADDHNRLGPLLTRALGETPATTYRSASTADDRWSARTLVFLVREAG